VFVTIFIVGQTTVFGNVRESMTQTFACCTQIIGVVGSNSDALGPRDGRDIHIFQPQIACSLAKFRSSWQLLLALESLETGYILLFLHVDTDLPWDCDGISKLATPASLAFIVKAHQRLVDEICTCAVTRVHRQTADSHTLAWRDTSGFKLLELWEVIFGEKIFHWSDENVSERPFAMVLPQKSSETS